MPNIDILLIPGFIIFILFFVLTYIIYNIHIWTKLVIHELSKKYLIYKIKLKIYVKYKKIISFKKVNIIYKILKCYIVLCKKMRRNITLYTLTYPI
jgi:hypothetical protein